MILARPRTAMSHAISNVVGSCTSRYEMLNDHTERTSYACMYVSCCSKTLLRAYAHCFNSSNGCFCFVIYTHFFFLFLRTFSFVHRNKIINEIFLLYITLLFFDFVRNNQFLRYFIFILITNIMTLLHIRILFYSPL